MARTYQLGPMRRAVNRLVTAMLRLGIGTRSSYLLTTTGRKTGQPRTTPVVLVETDGQRWLVSPYGQVSWVHNVRATPEVTLRRGRTIAILHAEEVAPDVAGPILKRYLHHARITAPFFDATTDDPAGTFAAEAEGHPVFELTEQAPSR